MTENNKCIQCGSVKLAGGKLQSTGRMYFRPDKVHFFALKTADLSMKGMMCLDCGNVQLIGDVKKAQSLVKDGEVAAKAETSPPLK